MKHRIDKICHQIVVGRRLARQLASVLRGYQFTEAEFRLLWLLHERVPEQTKASLEQRVLARELGISAAHVSSIVEKLRCQQIIIPVADGGDRRRQFWQFTDSGRECFDSVVAAVAPLSRGWLNQETNDRPRSQLEDAA